ncbi:MAG: DUF190 domain-containing protein [Candidatus Kapabacteria bacterium]|nr:DUF190 domain-containing protein [Candidatus Kapabacteria bacterium]
MSNLKLSAKQLRIYVGEQDKYNGKPLYEVLIYEALKAGIAGATAFRGILSYGSGSLVHSQKLLDLSFEMPVMIVIIDSEEKINPFIETANEIIESCEKGGLITLENVEIIKYFQGPGKTGKS